MGAGTFAAGMGGAGFDPRPQLSTPITQATPPRARKFDLATRAWTQNTDGTFADVHPVDQEVTLRLGIEQGTLATVSSFGQRFRKRMSRIAPSQIPNLAVDEVNRTLADLLSQGDIQILAVNVDAVARGATKIAVTYVNLRDPKTNLKSPTLSQKTVTTVAT